MNMNIEMIIPKIQSEEKKQDNMKRPTFYKIERESRESSNIMVEEEINLVELNHNSKFNKNEFIFKILFLGDTKVGKTSLITGICDGIFNKNYKKTLCCDMRKQKFKLDETTVEIKFYDIGDVDLEYNLSSVVEYLSIVHSVIFVVDAIRMQSLDKIEKLVKNFKCRGEMINFLVLNKFDLVESISQSNLRYTLSAKSQRVVDFDKSHNSNESSKLFSHIFQTSAKNNQTLQEFFFSVLNSMIEFYSQEKNFENYLKRRDSDNNKIFFKYKMKKINQNCGVHC